MIEEQAFWVAWAQINGVGSILTKRLQQQFGTLATAWLASKEQLMQVEGIGLQTVEAIALQKSRLDPEELFLQHQRQNPNFWTPNQTDIYPHLLLETASPPPVLYYLGKVAVAENHGTTPLVGIVGTRHASEYGKRWTRKISTALAKSGFTVVSGMAEGIDTEAHLGCLEAGGRTIAVLGTGVDIVYPPRNAELYQKILSQGLVVSEYSAKTPPDRSHFPQRNRIIAGLSRAVIVIEAPTRSGALITARFANDFCRDVYVLPGSLDNERSHGCLELISNGATIILGVEPLLEMLGAMPQLDANPAPQQLELLQVNLAPELKRVWEAIAFAAMPMDLIVQQTNMSVGEVSGALLQLELMDLVSQLPGMRYQRN
ncbi:DNA-processing protein DprA [Synechocystis sp. PCC 7509]|uniref:DNA-processing protein DprA n=1 Tax=Synechocystis sp. PCC 7509 TaxID=927677 RepID=UPI00048B1353|nr:DNA-processing protein DprA [Synechocystis sp. PCC 7509]